MRKQKPDSYSILLDVCIVLLKVGGGGLLVVFIGLIGIVMPLLSGLFFSFGFNDKQVEILVGTSTSWLMNVKQGEGKQYVSSMNRAQQASFAENNAFATSIDALGLGIKTETNNYKYSNRTTHTASFHYAISKSKTLKNYVGGVFLFPDKELAPNADRDERTTVTIPVTILCETEKRPFFRVKRKDELDEPAEPIYQNGEVICGKGTTELPR
jgi:type IV pilus assembly protein PilA